jgi:two-component system phosphate regulon response regulator PhoB
MKPKILVVDDEPDALELISVQLEGRGYDVITAADGDGSIEEGTRSQPALVILDVMLPEVDGLEVCKTLRREPATRHPDHHAHGESREIDRVLGLELGADDYVTKPFSPRELVLRVEGDVAPRQRRRTRAENLDFGDLQIDIPRHEVLVEAKRVTDRDRVQAPHDAGRTPRPRSVARKLLRDVWEYDSMIDTRTVDTHMRRLRDKLGKAARYLDTVRGVGYRLIEQ